MSEKKQALLIFTKPPLPGVVKTRMTTEYGGFLTMEQAAQFYKCCFYDVCEMSMHALYELQQMNDELVASDPDADKVTYDFFVSTTPAESLEAVKDMFDKIGPWPMEINYVVDTGKTFDEHFNDAFEQIFAMGYDSIVSIGGDVPTMPKSHLIQAFQWLDYFQSIGKPGFVYAPCQECGTSLVGFSHNTVMDHTGVYYNPDGRPALDGYLEKLMEADIPSAYFDPVADVDEITDLDFVHEVDSRGGEVPAAVRAPPHVGLGRAHGHPGVDAPEREPRPARLPRRRCRASRGSQGEDRRCGPQAHRRGNVGNQGGSEGRERLRAFQVRITAAEREIGETGSSQNDGVVPRVPQGACG